MRALLYKNYILILFFLSSGVAAFTGLVFEEGFADTFVTPEDRYFGSLGFAIPIWAVIYGWAAGAQDQVRGTLDYLYHRPLHAAQIFWGQVAWHLVVVVLCMVLPFVFLALFSSSAYEPEYLAEGGKRLAGMSLLLPCFAGGFLLAHLPLAFWMRVVLTVPVVFWLIGPEIDRSLDAQLQTNATRLFAMNWGITALLLMGAWHGFMAGHDRDRPVSQLAWLPILLILICLGWSKHFWINLGVQEIIQESQEVHLSQAEDGSIHPTRSVYDADRNATRRFRLDPRTHAILAEDNTLAPLRTYWPNMLRASLASTNHDNTGILDVGTVLHVETYAHKPVGFMAHFVWATHSQGFKKVLARPDGAFSPLATIAAKPRKRWDASVIVGDPRDGTIWICDWAQEDAKYAPLKRAGDLRFVRWVYVDKEIEGILAHPEVLLRAAEQGIQPTILCFEHESGFGTLVVHQQHAAAVSESTAAKIRATLEPKTQDGLMVFEVGANLLKPSFEVRNPAGEVVYRYTYAPRTWKERSPVLLAAGLSLLRSPIMDPIAFANVTELVEGEDLASSASWLHRVLGPRPLTLGNLRFPRFSPYAVIGWVLLIAAIAGMLRVLSKLGVSGLRLGLWALAGLAFGFVGVVFALILENRRAYRPVHLLQPEEEPPVWIRAAG